VPRLPDLVLTMNLRDSFDVRQAPGWWPSLVIVTCKACGEQSGTVDLNDSSQTNTFSGHPRWMFTHECSSR
jgi:hypothetical protein